MSCRRRARSSSSAPTTSNATSAPPASRRAGATCVTSVWRSPRRRRTGVVKLVSARWVVPIDTPPIAEGALALADDGAVLAVGRRAELRAEFPEVPELRAAGVLMPGLVNAHCHLELSLHADAVAGGHGLFAWATELMRVRAGDAPERVRDVAATAAAAAVALGTAAIGDVGNALAAV